MTGTAYCAAIDWGSTNLRIRILDGDGQVIDTFQSSEGLISLPERNFGEVLEKRLAGLGTDAQLPVVICGMAGSRQGWLEAPYLDIPAGLTDIPGAAVKVADAARPVHILPGLSQREPSADVMRGEETQLLGHSMDHAVDGVVCMPGTHSKWAHMAGGRIESFSTFMTGELFALLTKHSLLRFSVTDADAQPWARAAFIDGVVAIFEKPERFGDALFSIRADGLLKGVGPEDATARLSGLCVGLELAGAKHFLEAGPIEILASGVHAELYRRALDHLGHAHSVSDASEASRKGLYLAARHIHGAR